MPFFIAFHHYFRRRHASHLPYAATMLRPALAAAGHRCRLYYADADTTSYISPFTTLSRLPYAAMLRHADIAYIQVACWRCHITSCRHMMPLSCRRVNTSRVSYATATDEERHTHAAMPRRATLA